MYTKKIQERLRTRWFRQVLEDIKNCGNSRLLSMHYYETETVPEEEEEEEEDIRRTC
jgi:hypothetical protein